MREPSAIDEPTENATPVDLRWKVLTKAANKAFDGGDMERAATLYTEALHEAARRFRNDRAPETMADAPPMLVAACANVADHLARAHDEALAVTTMQWALDHMRAALLDPWEAPAFRQACFHHIRPALAEYAHRAEAARIDPVEFARVVRAARDSVRAFASENQSTH